MSPNAGSFLLGVTPTLKNEEDAMGPSPLLRCLQLCILGSPEIGFGKIVAAIMTLMPALHSRQPRSDTRLARFRSRNDSANFLAAKPTAKWSDGCQP